uniref:LRRcap domain-containing protein n=1 Tax=Trichuris muris TaxID=70415 RepID=A0A5S6QFC0_TRIMR
MKKKFLDWYYHRPKIRHDGKYFQFNIDDVDPPLFLGLKAAKMAKKVIKHMRPSGNEDTIAKILRVIKMTEVTCIENTHYVERVYDAIDLAAKPFKSVTSDKLEERPHCASVYVHPIFLELARSNKVNNFPRKDGFKFIVNTTLVINVCRRNFDYLHIAADDHAAEIDIMPMDFTYLNYHNAKKVYYDLTTTKANLPPGTKSKTCVVLPSGLSVHSVYMGSVISFMAGHQFVRVPATKRTLRKNLKDLYAACEAAKYFTKEYGRVPGVKMGLEVKTFEDALAYMTMADMAWGRKWVFKEFFRIGVTTMIDNSAKLLKALLRLKLLSFVGFTALSANYFGMDRRIEMEIGNIKPEEVVILKLDNCHAMQISGLNDGMTALEELSIANTGLSTLQDFPRLPSLLKLVLADNELEGGLEHLVGCQNLVKLNLSGNKIKELKELEPLKNLKRLKFLDLFACEVSRGDNYRSKVFEMLPQLQYLDGYSRKCTSFDSDEETRDYSGDDFDEDNAPSEGVDDEDDDEDDDNVEEEEDLYDDGDNDDDSNDEEETNDDGTRGTKRKFDEENET